MDHWLKNIQTPIVYRCKKQNIGIRVVCALRKINIFSRSRQSAQFCVLRQVASNYITKLHKLTVCPIKGLPIKEGLNLIVAVILCRIVYHTVKLRRVGTGNLIRRILYYYSLQCVVTVYLNVLNHKYYAVQYGNTLRGTTNINLTMLTVTSYC